MDVADSGLQRGVCYTPCHRATGGGAYLLSTLCFERGKEVFAMLADQLAIKLERVHVLADLLVTILADNPQAQVLAEIIMETSQLPEE